MKELLIFLAGAGIGAGITYFVMKSKIKKNISKIEEETKEKIREEETEIIQENLRQEMDIEECDTDELIQYYIDQLRDLGVGVLYNEEDDYDPEFDEVNPTDDTADIYPITDIVNNTTHNEYSKELIIYYEKDQTFVDDETKEPIDSWRQYFGNDIMENIGRHNWESGSLFIRNEALESDFQIILNEGSFGSANGDSDDEDDYLPGQF